MNLIHSVSEYWPFEEYYSRPYIEYKESRHTPRKGGKNMSHMIGIFAVIFVSVLALAVWQENQDINAGA